IASTLRAWLRTIPRRSIELVRWIKARQLNCHRINPIRHSQLLLHTETAPRGETADVLYEILHEAVDSKFVAMRDRFKSEVVPRRPRHSVECIGVFEVPEEDGGLTCGTHFKSEQARASAWAAFDDDPEWRVVEVRTE